MHVSVTTTISSRLTWNDEAQQVDVTHDVDVLADDPRFDERLLRAAVRSACQALVDALDEEDSAAAERAEADAQLCAIGLCDENPDEDGLCSHLHAEAETERETEAEAEPEAQPDTDPDAQNTVVIHKNLELGERVWVDEDIYDGEHTPPRVFVFDAYDSDAPAGANCTLVDEATGDWMLRGIGELIPVDSTAAEVALDTDAAAVYSVDATGGA